MREISVFVRCTHDRIHCCFEIKEIMSIIFQFTLFILVVWSFVMLIGVPVAYAAPQNWEQSKRLIFLGSIIWAVLVVVVGTLNYLVI
jgi:photosystem II PsbZ protein